ncbi:MAG: hypothetical protein M0Z25_09615 [Nitrospiraceae bacterium]|nr:hypothetical protein [Nitrospiraceae bacterium]
MALCLLLSGCSGSTNFSGSTPALPSGQTGSVVPLGAAPGDCYVSDTSSCSFTTGPQGTAKITALATVAYSSSNALFVGDANGNISYVTVPASSSLQTPKTCLTATGSILSLAIFPSGSSPPAGNLFYSTSNGVFYSSCSGSGPSTIITNPSVLTYNSQTSQIVGVTTAGASFTCSSTHPCTSPVKLPNFQGATVHVTAIASDPQYPVVYVTTSTNGSYAVNIYSVSGQTLSFLGSYTGGELNAPAAIAVFHGPNPTQNYCTNTTGGCNFLDVANAGDNALTQYVLTYTLSGNVPTGVSLNQYNGAYLGCELFDPGALAAIANPIIGAPAVFLGENGTSLGPCLGGGSGGTSFGNNVTAYTVMGE